MGDSGIGVYSGAAESMGASSDLLVLSTTPTGAGFCRCNSATTVGINLPAGLLFQAGAGLAVTLQTGYSVVFRANSGQARAAHFIPIDLEAVLTPVPQLDIGARFFLDGYVAGIDPTPVRSYLDRRAVMLWLRVRVGARERADAQCAAEGSAPAARAQRDEVALTISYETSANPCGGCAVRPACSVSSEALGLALLPRRDQAPARRPRSAASPASSPAGGIRR